MDVEYKDIPGFPGYRVGNDGSVWGCRKKGKFSESWIKLKPFVTGKNKRLSVKIYPGRTFHGVGRLVLESFVGTCPKKYECCHNNGNFKDNRLENLRWDTRKANAADKLIHGTDNRGSKHARSKLTEDQVREIKRKYRAGEATQAGLARQHGVSGHLVYEICNEKRWTHVD